MTIIINLSELLHSTPQELEALKTSIAPGLGNPSETFHLSCNHIKQPVRDELIAALLGSVPDENRNEEGLPTFIENSGLFSGPLKNQILAYFKNHPHAQDYHPAPTILGTEHAEKGDRSLQNMLGASLVSISACFVLGLSWVSWPYFTKPKLDTSQLVIGTIGQSQNQFALAQYLEDSFVPRDYWQFLQGQRIQVLVDGDNGTQYEAAKERIDEQLWDIGFTMSPILSIYAKQRDYQFAARMFPDSKDYEAALFVRSDSPLRSVDDLTEEHRVALGEYGNSASSFFMPVFDLYGRRLQLDLGNRGKEIVEKIVDGRADVGSAASSYASDPNLRFLSQSRKIPGAGVYLSPKLSEGDRQLLTEVMLGAPEEIRQRKASNYGPGEESDYSFFMEIVERVEEIMDCSDFQGNPVDLFCAEGMKIEGTINGWQQQSDRYQVTLATAQGIHHVIVPESIMGRLGQGRVSSLQNQNIAVKVPLDQMDASTQIPKVMVAQASQISLLD